MSTKYDEYIIQHKENVNRGLAWLKDHGLVDEDLMTVTFDEHDISKYDPEEYAAYDAYFYGGNRSYKVVDDFRTAWLRHIRMNPHHWQYWVLINDEPSEGIVPLAMPKRYALEMVCDWWAFSWSSGNLTEIFDWYDKHKDYIKLHRTTRNYVEGLLEKIKANVG